MKKKLAVRKASILGIIFNIFLLIIKAIIGFVSGSMAMVADAFNSAGDIIASLMTFIGNRVASKKADDDHNLGHGKAEYIYSMLISITMMIMAYTVGKSSILSLINKEEYTFSIWIVIVCIITIVTKLSLYIYTNKLYKKTKNILIKAASKDHFNDTIITSLNLIASFLALNNIFFVDGVVGTIISLWILYTGIKIFIESYHILMDKSIDEETKQKVLDIISEHKEIHKIQHFNSTPVGYKYQISFTIYVDGNLSTFESHEIANNLEKEIIKKIEEAYLVVIHVNPL
ncbi:MAG: cation transporter [Bacilli bacterium]|nr:cation transporter [Bacilli bacterium]